MKSVIILNIFLFFKSFLLITGKETFKNLTSSHKKSHKEIACEQRYHNCDKTRGLGINFMDYDKFSPSDFCDYYQKHITCLKKFNNLDCYPNRFDQEERYTSRVCSRDCQCELQRCARMNYQQGCDYWYCLRNAFIQCNAFNEGVLKLYSNIMNICRGDGGKSRAHCDFSAKIIIVRPPVPVSSSNFLSTPVFLLSVFCYLACCIRNTVGYN